MCRESDSSSMCSLWAPWHDQLYSITTPTSLNHREISTLPSGGLLLTQPMEYRLKLMECITRVTILCWETSQSQLLSQLLLKVYMHA